MIEKQQVKIVPAEDIKFLVYTIRGQQVMLDSDLEQMYGYEVKALNQQVKRNVERFPEDFMFRLTEDEYSKYIRSQNVTLNEEGSKRGTHRKYLPYVFTEQGVYMLAADLAEIYGYTTKAVNQQVRNNIEKFEEDFRFQLTSDETAELRSKFLTANINPMSRYEPFVFTEAGIYMLMTVLKGDLAVRQSKALIRTFKAMKDYIQQEPLLYDSSNLIRLSLQVSQNTKDISEIKEKMVIKDDLTKVIQSFSLPEKGIKYVIYAGQTFEADAAYADIYRKAKKKLYIVDNYFGPKILLMLKIVSTTVDVIILSPFSLFNVYEYR